MQPIPGGVYARDGDPADRYRVQTASGGWYDIEKLNANGAVDESRRVLFNAVTLEDGRPAFAIAEETPEGFDYAVALINLGRVQFATPDCTDPSDRNLAVDHGAAEDDDGPMTHNCLFKDRGALLSALSAFAGQADFGRPYQRH